MATNGEYRDILERMARDLGRIADAVTASERRLQIAMKLLASLAAIVGGVYFLRHIVKWNDGPGMRQFLIGVAMIVAAIVGWCILHRDDKPAKK